MQRSLGVVASVLVMASVLVVVPAGATDGTFEAQIANGEPSTGTAAIAQVFNQRQGSMCSGVFVADQWVLTAAHCVRDGGSGQVTPAWALFVYVDGDGDGYLPPTDYTWDNDFTVGVDRVVVHATSDVALVRLATALPFTAAHFPIATLPSEPDLEGGSVLLVGYGWGQTYPSDTFLTQLYYGSFVPLSTSGCESRVGPIAANEFCFWDPAIVVLSFGLYEPCPGDSGGPIFAQRTNGDLVIVGVMTGSNILVGSLDCDGTGALGRAERIAPLATWIVDQVPAVNLAGPLNPPPPPPPPPTTQPPAPQPPPAPAPALPPAAASSNGYWMLDRDGRLYAYGDAATIVPTGTQAPVTSPATKVVAHPSGTGVWVLETNGTVHALGGAPHYGNVVPGLLVGDEAATTMAATSDGGGYWVFTDRGRAIRFGNARHLGDMLAVPLNGPIVDSVGMPDGAGYYMVGSDGGIFSFGSARFHGSMGGIPLNQPVNGLVPDPDGAGYWLVAADGGVFAFNAGFRGSMGSVTLNQPVNGMVAYGNGYLMVASDGGVFNFSDLDFLGSLGGTPIPAPIVGIAPTAA